jgi:chemotaxis protein MotB
MSASRRRAHAGAHESEERWLLTYADMITLLMALFMVLFSISSVNVSKYQTLQEALKAAFSGSVLPGGTSVQQTGNSPSSSQAPATSAEPEAIVPSTPSLGVNGGATAGQKAALAAQQQQQNLEELKQLVQEYANQHGLSKVVQAQVNVAGLEIRILSDHVLFASGQATLQSQAAPLLSDISHLLLAVVPKNPIVVEGYTDSVPTDTSQFPSNWYLSSARADAVLEFLLSSGVNPQLLSAEGRASLDPIASNATTAGRAQNRRVVIGVQRTGTTQSNYTITQPGVATTAP